MGVEMGGGGEVAMRDRLPLWLWGPGCAAAGLLALPLLALALRVPWPSVPALLQTPAARDALWLSLVTASWSTLLSVLIGVPLAVLLARLPRRAAGLARAVVTVPMVLPPVVAGLALLVALGRRGLLGAVLSGWGVQIGFTPLAVVLAQTFVAMPLLVTSVEGALRARDTAYEQVAATLGASPTRTLLRVTLPLTRPAIAAGTALAFARALGEFGATLTFAGSLQGVTRTLPLEIYLQREADTDSALALAAVLIAVALALTALTARLARPAEEPV